MGYRSDVTILIYGDAEPFAQFKAEAERRLSQCHERTDYDESEFKACFDEPDQFLLEAKDRKWYEEYEGVQFYEGLFDLAGDLGLNAEFVRIGEEPADVVDKYRGSDIQYRLYVDRRIIVD